MKPCVQSQCGGAVITECAANTHDVQYIQPGIVAVQFITVVIPDSHYGLGNCYLLLIEFKMSPNEFTNFR